MTRRTVSALLLVLVVAGGVGCATRGAVPKPFPGASAPPVATPTAIPPDGSPAGAGATIESPPGANTASMGPAGVIATALALVGLPYRNGGSTPEGFDCSGLVQWVFSRLGAALPREVRDQFRIGQPVSRNDVRPGDLVFFETISRGASHVGIVTGDAEFVHAPSSRGVVRIERFTEGYWSKRFVGARRVVEHAD